MTDDELKRRITEYQNSDRWWMEKLKQQGGLDLNLAHAAMQNAAISKELGE